MANPTNSFPFDSYDMGQYYTSIDNFAAATGPGKACGVGPFYQSNDTPKQITWEVLQTGTSSTISAQLEGSNDGTNWYQLDVTTTIVAAQARSVVNKPFRFYRINVTVLTGAAGNITGRIFIA